MARHLLRILTIGVVTVGPMVSIAAADTTGTLDIGGLRREYELHVPSSLQRRPAPLVVVLHGGGAQDDLVGMIRDLTKFNAQADAAGFVVVYPKAIEHYWNDGRGLSRYRSHTENIDDVGFIGALVDHIAATTPVDRRRVYATGASNGAMMAYRLGCERADLFAAVAAVAGNLPVRLACRPARPVPVLVMNGTDDPLMPWNGGEVRFGAQRLGQVRSTEDTVAQWTALDDCTRAPATDTLPNRAPLDGTRVVRTRYAPCAGGSEVRLYRIEGGGHTWPGGREQTTRAVVGRTSRDIDATEVIWSFFDQHRGSSAPASAFGPFRAPERIEIRGYRGSAMEPAISPDERVLVFNDVGERGADKNLFWARRANDGVFEFMGPLAPVNSPAVEASPNLSVPGTLYFTSLRDYPRSFATLYRGRFVDGRLSDVQPITGDLYRQETSWATLDPDLTPDGQTMVFAVGRFGGGPAPQEMDVRIARRDGDGYRMDPQWPDTLRHINTAEHLEYAPAISPDGLELFFTRAQRSGGKVIGVGIYRATRRSASDAFGPPAVIDVITGFVEGPSLSADGRSLYFHRKDGDRFFIYRVTRDGSRR